MTSLSLANDRRWFALGILCTGMLMIVLDNTVVNVALSSIQSDLHFTDSGLAWVVNAYMIAYGGFLLLAGRLGDLIGTKRVFTAGLIAFTLGSLLCGLANSQMTLILARFVAGVGGAFAAAVILAMIFTTFEEGAERARALSLFSFTAAAGGSVGLVVGGFVAQVLNWHWIFLINVPIGIVALILSRDNVVESKPLGLRRGADFIGAVLVTASLMLAVYTVVRLPETGLSAIAGITGLSAIVLFAVFLARQARISTPLLPLAVFSVRNVVATNVMQVLIVVGLFAFFFLYSLFVRKTLGYDALHTGFAFLPITLVIGALSLGPASKIMTRFGPKRPLIAGTAIAALGLAIFAVAPLDAPYVAVMLPGMLLLGIGMGIAFPCIMEFAMAGADASNSGLISGLVNTTAEVGGALGLAALAAIAQIAGERTSFAVGTVSLVAACVIGLALRAGDAPALQLDVQVEEEAEGLDDGGRANLGDVEERAVGISELHGTTGG